MTYLLITCTIWIGNPDETYQWSVIRMSDIEKLHKFALSIKRGFKKDNTVLLGMKIVKIDGATASERIEKSDKILNGTQKEIENAFDTHEAERVYKV